MQESKDQTTYFFVDESGDTTFYNKKGDFIVGEEGCSKILLLGFIKTKAPEELRFALTKLREELLNDPYLENIPSMEKTAVAFHAKDDCPEVRHAVYKILSELDFHITNCYSKKNKNRYR